ncbi:MAG: winged helix DNA-binding domain-containing protein [Candidatus Pristimantibacillus sp.]
MLEQSIAYRRLLHLHINSGSLDKPEQVVKQLGALQAQDYNQALWAVGLRAQSSTVVDIEQAITDRKIILTWLMRGTIHFVSPEDVRWMLELTASRILAQSNRTLERVGLTQEIIERSKLIIYDALQGNKQISRPFLIELLEQEGISTTNERGYHLLWYLAKSGHICLGPKEGKQQTFVLLDEWVPKAKELSKIEALGKLAERYFTSHGPATVHDFAWWAGITVTDASKGLEVVQSRLVSEKVNDLVYWESEREQKGLNDNYPSVVLLPGFDEYLLGYKDRSMVLRAEYAAKIVPGKNGVFMPIIIIDGQVAGIWKRSIKKTSVDIEFDLFDSQEDRRESILEAADRYCAFMGLPLGATAFK